LPFMEYQLIAVQIALLSSELTVINEWKIPSGTITTAAATPTQAAVAQGKNIYFFEIGNSGLNMRANTMLSDDVADIIYDNNNVGKILFVALWRSNSVHVSECFQTSY